MNHFVSLVIPGYNIKYLLELNLYTLYQQTYPTNRYEVIVVDDGSTDGTPAMCQKLKTPYQLKVLQIDKNLGRAVARNLGAGAAEGEIIIFVDGDTLQPPEFIKNHMKSHIQGDNLVLSSLPLYYTISFTHFYEDFSKWQKNELFKLAPHLKEKVSNGKRLLSSRKLLANFDNVRQLSLTPDWFDDYFKIIKHYKSFSCVPSSWMAFTASNVSLARRLFLESGGFDENFYYWGMEDWELGYRLKTLGAHFDCKQKVMNFHQEHPRDEEARRKSDRANYTYFCSKYDTPEIYLFSNVDFPEKGCSYSLLHYNKLVSQYLDIQGKPSYTEFVFQFHLLVKADFNRRFLHKRFNNLYLGNKERFGKVLKELGDSHKELVQAFKKLSDVTKHGRK
jgi:glycosyltransferase involved in cell wall biosynthesis